MSAQPSISEYFSAFGERLARLARAQGVEIETPTIDSHVAAEVLELAGAVARSSERKFAPLASFLTGVAVGSLRSAGQLQTDREVVAFVAELRQNLGGSSQDLR